MFERRKRRDKRSRGGRIVRAIDDETSDALKSPRPANRRRNPRGRKAKHLQRGEGGDSVLAVERTCQGKIGGNLAFVREVRRIVKRRANLLRPAADDLDDRRLVAAEDDRNARLDDASLLRGDLLDRIAEPVAVVETDLRDDANRRIADIRRIKPSAQSAFENRIVDLRLSAKLKRNRRQRLEKGNLPSPSPVSRPTF